MVLEKPIALTKSDAERIVFKSLEMSRSVFCVMQNRYSPPSVWLKALMDGSPVELNECASAMIIAALFHDCCKRGLPDQPRSERTMFEHPLLGAKFIMDKSIEFLDKNRDFIETTSDDEDWFKEQIALIASCVQSHMGKWNTSKFSPDIVLPLPKTNIQQLVHLADYCASRKFTTFDVTFFNDIMSKGEKK